MARSPCPLLEYIAESMNMSSECSYAWAPGLTSKHSGLYRSRGELLEAFRHHRPFETSTVRSMASLCCVMFPSTAWCGYAWDFSGGLQDERRLQVYSMRDWHFVLYHCVLCLFGQYDCVADIRVVCGSMSLPPLRRESWEGSATVTTWYYFY